MNSLKAFFVLMASMLGMLLPTKAFASGGEDVTLNFASSDLIYLYVSLFFGALAVLCAWFVGKQVMAQSPGDEKMQSVGLAIREGALAYLKQQVKTMLYFVGALALVLGVYYSQTYSAAMGIAIAVCFMAGVGASYGAGYIGMLMAVNGNMRTASAALTSYKRALEVAFRSGAVAGLVTVGMGLIGATLIFLIAKGDAMKLLVGFGFGGSLAALFMRVGGGIFTKAADVGADLVGKVEAGIPEDDPRNPAVIADNVGDNVGDCAGMAADIFESYEVTLVAAIVLGAATAAIFDQTTWMKLILFALMARGVGIIASIIGIFMVKGSDNVDDDPLKAIRRGFTGSAIIAGVATLVLAFFMMGGMSMINKNMKPIGTDRLVSLSHYEKEEHKVVVQVREEVAKSKGIPSWQIKPEDIKDDPRIKALKFDEGQPGDQMLQQALMPDNMRPKEVVLQGYKRIDRSDKNSVLYKYSTMKPAEPGDSPTAPQYITLGDFFDTEKEVDRDGKKILEKVNEIVVFKINFSQPEQKGPDGQTVAATSRVIWIALPKNFLLEQKKMMEENKLGSIEILHEAPLAFYATDDGSLAAGIEAPVGTGPQQVEFPHRVIVQLPSYYKYSPDEMAGFAKEMQEGKIQSLPQQNIELGHVDHQVVPWYLFAFAIIIGILMAFAFEAMTDYYVSTHKKPVQEVAGVATAGPAPMIISGFALACESSVFSVLAIVVALIVPMFLFPPALYGGLILSFYGIALVGLGLLTTTGFILAMDTFGPISDNAQGVFEMSGAGHTSPEGAKAVQRLDAAGNTTKALTKGFAIATAVVAAVALFHSYIESAKLTGIGLPLDVPAIFLGFMIGGAAPFLFAAFSINAVGRAAFELINEVRRQFRNDPGIMAGTSKPNYGSCVAIVTKAAQTELLGPGVLAIALPLATAFGFAMLPGGRTTIGGVEYNLSGAQALGGFLAGSILSGQLLAVMLANSGGIWDNAKKVIEDGLHGGKGTEAHKAAVVCDTVGDPFKDTAGPALNPLIKVMNLVALLLAPTIILPYDWKVLATITTLCLAALAFSIWWSKRASMLTGMEAAVAQAPAAGKRPLDAPAPKKRITVDDDESEGEKVE
ncbi:MAG: sodium/proton-translocating pyrophosphatase [Fimbriimonadaceae bacterium]|nr:sodium/proton-translocating pyrophosphatase [Fimbriimonadaceae bacterium]